MVYKHFIVKFTVNSNFNNFFFSNNSHQSLLSQMVEWSWVSWGIRICQGPTTQMVHLLHGLSYRSRVVRPKDWPHKTHFFYLHNRWHFRCSWHTWGAHSLHRSYQQVYIYCTNNLLSLSLSLSLNNSYWLINCYIQMGFYWSWAITRIHEDLLQCS